MTKTRDKNSAWVINDAFDNIRSSNYIIWIDNFNKSSVLAGSKKIVISHKTLAKSISFWYISIKIIKLWNQLDKNNDHWKFKPYSGSFLSDTYTIEELCAELNASEGHDLYKFETIRRYVGEMCSIGLLRRAGNINTGRIQPSSYLAYAVAVTQKQWMSNYVALGKAMSESIVNCSEKWETFELLGSRRSTVDYFSDDRAKAQFV